MDSNTFFSYIKTFKQASSGEIQQKKSWLLLNDKKVRQFYLFIWRRRILKKQFRFIKRVKRRFFFSFVQFIKQTFGTNFVIFLLKRYYSKYLFNKKITKLFKQDLKIVKISRFTTFLTYQNFFLRKRQLLRLLVRSLKGPQLAYSFSNNTTFEVLLTQFLKKNHFRFKLSISTLSVFRLIKLSSIFSKKGNNALLFKKMFNDLIGNRQVFFNVFYRFFENIFLPVKLRKNFLNFTGKKIFDFVKFKNLMFDCSVLFRKASGFFYKFMFKHKFDNNKIIFCGKLLSFRLHRLKGLTVLSSFRLLESLLKLFYLNVDIRTWKKSGRSILVPTPIKSKIRRLFLFNHWIKFFVLNNRKENSISKKIFGEFYELSLRKGFAIKKLNIMRKTIRANRALIRKSRISLL